MLENIVDCVLTTSTLLKEERRYELILLVRMCHDLLILPSDLALVYAVLCLL